jgi:hypothetical protein
MYRHRAGLPSFVRWTPLPAATTQVALYRWARHRTVRAEHAAIAREGLEPFAATLAVVEELASIGRHRLGALLHFIDRFVPAFLAFIDDRVMAATHRRSDRLDCHDRGWIAVGTILKPYGLRPVRQLGCQNFTHDQRLVLMQEREVSRSSIDIKLEYPLWGVPVLICIKIKTGHCEPRRRALSVDMQ